MSLLLTKPAGIVSSTLQARFEKYNLKENPFPSAPVVNKESNDDRINGKIFEMEIRRKEYELFDKNFLSQPQNDQNHIRLGFMIDTSFVGRGNGKSAFLVNLYNRINSDYCLGVSSGQNKCFSVYMTPEPGGRTKTYGKFVENFYNSIIETGIIKTALAVIRLDALLKIDEVKLRSLLNFENDSEIVDKLNSMEWFDNNKISIFEINRLIRTNDQIAKLNPDFPLFKGVRFIMPQLTTENDFIEYFNGLKRDEDIYKFVFDDLIKFFLAAGFNGAYVFVDDFERIPDFQSARQKKDFALELRTCLFDGLYENAKVGFYNFVFVLHAGVPRLISEAWGESGMENRAPIASPISSKHIIPFEKLTIENAKLLVMKYLSEYRIQPGTSKSLDPFTEDVVNKIAEISEYNAAKILHKTFMLLEKASSDPDVDVIDSNYLSTCIGSDIYEDKPDESISLKDTVNLFKKASE